MMKKTLKVKELMLLSLFVAIAWSASAQLKVGDNPNTINKGSVLELEAKDKGILYPRVALTASNVWVPLQGTAVVGMTVYNTATVSATTSATTNLTPGFYFWEGAKWNKLAVERKVAAGAEWGDDATASGTQLIYANQAKTAGNDVVITDDGSVGIGTTMPTAKLAIQSTNQQALNIGDGTTTNLNILNDGRIVYGYDDPATTTHILSIHRKLGGLGGIRLSSNAFGGHESSIMRIDAVGGAGRMISDNSMYFFIDSDNNSTQSFFRILNDNTSAAGTAHLLFSFEENGQAYKSGGGSWSVFSDKRAKENIKDYTKGLEELLQVRPVSYNYKKSMEGGNKTYVGVIAQELEKIAPSMVEEIEKGTIKDFKTVDPNEFTYMLINAVKEQQKRIEELEKRVNQLLKK